MKKIVFALIILFSASSFCQEHTNAWHRLKSLFVKDPKVVAQEKYLNNLINKEFETIHDLIKTPPYQEQKECFLRSNCPTHPMDDFTKKMAEHNVSVPKLVDKVLNQQEKNAIEKTKKQYNLTSNHEQFYVRKMLNQVNAHKVKTNSTITYDNSIKDKISPEIKEYIEKTYRSNKIHGNLTVSLYEQAHNAGSHGNPYTGENRLLIGEKILASEKDIQKGTTEHEISHLATQDTLYKTAVAIALVVDPVQFSRIPTHVSHFMEYRADQKPSSKSFESALNLEMFFKLQASNKPYYDQFESHPDNLKRYNAVKTIRQLHEANQRAQEGKSYPRFTPEQYEKYVVGSEKAWDKYFSQLKQQEIKRTTKQLMASTNQF